MMPNKLGVYQIQSDINSKRYVGSAKNLKKRKQEHFNLLRKQDHFNIHLQRHYNKYSEADLQFSIIERCLVERLIEKEQYYIDTLKPEFNILPKAGSCLGVKHTEEHNRKIGEAGTGRKHSEETKRKMSIANTGKKRTEETKRKIRESWKNREPCSEETKKKIRENHKGMSGKKHSEESNQKNREAHTGIKQSKETIKKRIKKNTGKKRTKESKKKMSIAIKARWKTPEYRRNRKLINTNFNH